MKKIFFTFSLLASTLILLGQQSPLPNQFRDYLDHQIQYEKPLLERKNGKVIITMTEEHFRMMRYMRILKKRQLKRSIVKKDPICRKCLRKQKRNNLN